MLPRLSRCLRFSSAALAHGSPLGLLPLQRGMATGQPAVALSQLQHVQWQKEPQGFVTVLLNRAKEFNTFNAQVIAELDAVWRHLHELHADSPLRGVFFRSAGDNVFCAGADLKWMKNSVNNTMEENIADAVALSRMLHNFNTLPCATIALVHGPAFGGGVGLVSCCDIAIGTKKASFTLSEVKLGLIPATISPFVCARIGVGHSRRYMLTAETIEAGRAKEIGLLQEVVETTEELNKWEATLKSQLGKLAPGAVSNTKSLIRAVDKPIDDVLLQETAARLARQRAGEECQKGLAAFFNKQPAPWVLKEDK